MAVNATRIVRRMNWTANKRSMAAARRVPQHALDEVQHLHADGAYEDALTALEGFVSWRNDHRAWRLYGLCQLGLKQYDAAVAAFETAKSICALEIAKDNVNKATTLIAAGDLGAAREAADQALQMAPHLPTAHVCRLSIANRSGDAAAVKGILEETITKFPDILEDPYVAERLENDTDLVGILAALETIRRD